MNCYICSRAGATRPAVGMCRHCGAGLCEQHFKEAQAFTVGGTTAYRCPHPIEAAGVAKSLPDQEAAREEADRRV